MEKVDIMLRCEWDGQPLLVYPHIVGSVNGRNGINCKVFSFNEGHSAACWDYVLKQTKPLKGDKTKMFLKDLEKTELSGVPYRIVLRRSYLKLLKDYHNQKDK